ncbi:MAG TPA: sigma-70 family RNA polymerase sigma factor [Verrucomicrobiae bacterium]|nr:sigma-70 family RNA polymerase sigma factor [Verrucomicrobiae bacterium]
MEENVQLPELSAADAAPPDPVDIAALTRAMTRGDEMAYRTFYQLYFDRLLRYLLVVAGGNEDVAREALQLALVRVVRHIKVFDDDEKFWSWLTVLARSAFADERKKSRRYFSFLERFSAQAGVENDGAADPGADRQLQNLLQQNLAALPADEQQILQRKYLDRQNVRSIAEELDTTEKAVESKLSRLRKKLKNAVLAELKRESQA